MSKSLELKKALAAEDEQRYQALETVFVTMRDKFLSAIEKAVESVERLRSEHATTTLTVKESLKNALTTMSERAESERKSTKKTLDDTLASLLKDFRAYSDKIDARIASLKDGEDADESIVADIAAELVLERMELSSTLAQYGESFRDGLELLPEGSKLSIDAIEGLEELLINIKKTRGAVTMGGAVAARDFIKTIDLSAQLDGVTATFNLPAVYNIVSVATSSFPNILRPVIDYTWTTTSITFTSQIDPASTLAAGQTVIITVVNA